MLATTISKPTLDCYRMLREGRSQRGDTSVVRIGREQMFNFPHFKVKIVFNRKALGYSPT